MRVPSSSWIGFVALCLFLTAAAPAAQSTSGSGVPLAYNAIADRNVYPEPLPPAIGSAGFIFGDPTFHSKIVRVTDAYTDPLRLNMSWHTKASAAANAWNVDSTKFIVEANGHDAYFNFNPWTLTVGFGGYLPLQGMEFSFVDPDLIYGVSGFRLGSYRVSAATATLLSDPTTCPGISNLSGGAGGTSVSGGDRRILVPMNGSQGLWNILYVFDQAMGCRWYNTQTGQVGGQWGPTGSLNIPDRFGINDARISKDGKYVVIEVGVVDAGNPSATAIWNLDTLAVTPLSVNPGRPGVAGYGYMINRADCGASQNACIRPLNNVTQVIDLIEPPIAIAGDGNLSWNNAQADKLVPVCMSSYLVNAGVQNPYEAEIDCVRTDRIASTVWRFAHPRSKVWPRGDLNYNFWDTPRGNVSQDGRYYVFTSNWENTLGRDPWGRFRQDAFIVELAAPPSGTTALAIGSVAASNITSFGATITWTTNEPAASRVEYGLTTAYGHATPVDPTLVTNHSVALTGLASDTSYHYRVVSQDAGGNRVTSGDFTFRTSAIEDSTPPIISSVAVVHITSSGATLSWTTNEPATSQANYGLTSSYGKSTSLDLTLATSHSVTLSGLTANTTYHYQVLSRDAAGNLATSGDFTFRTGAGPTSSSRIPLTDMGATLYLGRFPGGLYPNQSNTIPSDHAAAGSAKAALIRPLDVTGNPSPNGRYVMVAIGMSNTTDEFCHESQQVLPCDPFTFMGNVAADATINKSTLVLIDGAASGMDASTWVSPTTNYSRIRDNFLTPAGLSEAQVQIGWVKVANRFPSVSLPATNADAYILESQIGQIVRAMKVRYKNLQQVSISSRIYAGYATTNLNPEPYAYESGFAVKNVVQAQINQMRTGVIDPVAGDLSYKKGTAPWIAWGPYLWADGTKPRSDGLTWLLSDFELDGTHPSSNGRQKVASQLLKFFKTSPQTSCWFLAGRVCQ